MTSAPVTEALRERLTCVFSSVAKDYKTAFVRFFGFCCLVVAFAHNARAQASASLTLAAELFAESNYPACRLECQRLFSESPVPAEARLLKAQAELELGLDSSVALAALAEDKTVPATVALTARYEWARARWGAGDWRSAFGGFRQVFNEAEATALSVRAGCALALLLKQHPKLAGAYPEIKPQLQTLRAIYSREIINACRPPRASAIRQQADPQRRKPQVVRHTPDAWHGAPGQWLIAFYQRQIRPALGERCSLSPNCSEYARQAFRKHGILGLALVADRFFREPSVVAAAEQPVKLKEKWYYADPLSAHDWWLGGRKMDDRGRSRKQTSNAQRPTSNAE